MESNIKTENLAAAIKEIATLATEAANGRLIHLDVSEKGQKLDIPVLVYPNGDGEVRYSVLTDAMREGLKLAREERLLNADGPDRRQGIAKLQSIQSFIDHANRFKAEHSAIWANAFHRELVSVLDYHPEGADSPPRWGKHRGSYSCPLSEAWRAWGGVDGLDLSQDEFAELLDGRDRELAVGKLPTGKEAPDPSLLVTLATNLEVYSNASAKRERDPNTGRVKITFHEENGVAGAVQPPTAFLIHIPVFEDSEPSLLEVRLRVTVKDGAARFSVGIHMAADVLRQAFNGLCMQVESETDLPVFVGTPE